MDTTDKLDEFAASFGIVLRPADATEAQALALGHLAAVHPDRPTPCRYCGPDAVKLLAQAATARAARRTYRLVGGTLTPRAEIPPRRDWATCSLDGCTERLHPNERLPHVDGLPYCGDLDADAAQRAGQVDRAAALDALTPDQRQAIAELRNRNARARARR